MLNSYKNRVCKLTSNYLDSCVYEMEIEYHNTLHMVDHIKEIAERYFPVTVYGNTAELVSMAQKNGIDHVQYPGWGFTDYFPVPFVNATDDFDYFIKVIENRHFDLKNAYEAYVNLAIGFLMGRGTVDFENPPMSYINQAFFDLDYTEQLEHSVESVVKEGKMFNYYKEQYKHGFENFVRRMREMDDFTSEYHNNDKWPRSAKFDFDHITKIFNFIKWACQLNVKIFHSFSNAFAERALQYKGIYDAMYVEFINKGIIKIVEPDRSAREYGPLYRSIGKVTQDEKDRQYIEEQHQQAKDLKTDKKRKHNEKW